MIEREKVIKALDLCKYDPDPGQTVKYLHSCVYCPYWNDGVAPECSVMYTDAIAMLKEQEAKQVELYGKEDWYGLVCVCPDCKAVWMSGESETHFCPNCGRPLKWE